MSIDLSVTNKPAVQKKAEEEPDNREQIRDFVQKAAPQKAERARKKHPGSEKDVLLHDPGSPA